MNGPDLINNVLRAARDNGQRTGQYLFNSLPDKVAEAVGGTLFDPFYKSMDAWSLTQWVEEHLVFGRAPGKNEGIIAVIDGSDIIWSEAPAYSWRDARSAINGR